MLKRELNGLENTVSPLVYGCAGDVMQSGADNGKILDATLDAGINLIKQQHF